MLDKLEGVKEGKVMEDKRSECAMKVGPHTHESGSTITVEGQQIQKDNDTDNGLDSFILHKGTNKRKRDEPGTTESTAPGCSGRQGCPPRRSSLPPGQNTAKNLEESELHKTHWKRLNLYLNGQSGVERAAEPNSAVDDGCG